MLQNAYFLAKIGTDTAENEQHFAGILPTDISRAVLHVRRRRPRRCEEPQGPLGAAEPGWYFSARSNPTGKGVKMLVRWS